MKRFQEFIPKSYVCFRDGYRFSTFKKDLIAGITVGIISLPLAMAFAIASGVTPERGLFTAIVAGFIISALGGSRVQIGGPTGAFVVILYGIIQRTGYEGLALSTLVAAVILIVLGILRLGSWIKYVPHSLVTGFTTGIAVLIFSSQIKDFFDLKMQTPPAEFIAKWSAYFDAFPTFDSICLSVAAGTLLMIVFIRHFLPRLPWGIAGIVLSTLICWAFQIPIETIHSKFGAIPHSLSWPHMPTFTIPEGKFGEIVSDGCVIAFLGAIESLLCCVIADRMIGDRHQSNCELIGQGLGNFASILFGGISATGAIARTAANVKTGAQTPVAGIIHALTLLAILLFFSPMVSQIPLPALAAVLMMVAWNMSELDSFIRLLKAPIGDVVILMAGFLLTVLVDITVAITVGMVLASFIFMKRMSSYSQAIPVTQSFREKGNELLEQKKSNRLANLAIAKGIEIYDIRGPFFFGAADLLHNLLKSKLDCKAKADLVPRVCILNMDRVPIMDASGMHALKDFFDACCKQKTVVLLSGIQDGVQKDIETFGFSDLIGKENFFSFT